MRAAHQTDGVGVERLGGVDVAHSGNRLERNRNHKRKLACLASATTKIGAGIRAGGFPAPEGSSGNYRRPKNEL